MSPKKIIIEIESGIVRGVHTDSAEEFIVFITDRKDEHDDDRKDDYLKLKEEINSGELTQVY